MWKQVHGVDACPLYSFFHLNIDNTFFHSSEKRGSTRIRNVYIIIYVNFVLYDDITWLLLSSVFFLIHDVYIYFIYTRSIYIYNLGGIIRFLSWVALALTKVILVTFRYLQNIYLQQHIDMFIVVVLAGTRTCTLTDKDKQMRMLTHTNTHTHIHKRAKNYVRYATSTARMSTI